MDDIYETGVMRTAMTTHPIISLAIVAVFYVFAKPLLLPVILGVLSHLISDIPNYRRAFGQKG